METDNKESNQHVVSRLSKMQKQVLAVLVNAPQPFDDPARGGRNISRLYRTGNIIDALGRDEGPQAA